MSYKIQQDEQIQEIVSFYNPSENSNQFANQQLHKEQNKFSSSSNEQMNNTQIINENIFLVENQLQNKNKSNQTNKINGNQQNQNIVEVEDFYEIGEDTYQMITQRKGKKNKSFKDDQKEQLEENKYIGVIFKNKSSIVDLQFKEQFIITKQNLIEQEQFERENKILELLKNNKITLDIVLSMRDKYQFQQIAGKSNLFQLKQKIQSKIINETFYFILLDKLNKMHELGVAHSDIKPQNIVISFDNEPFFIDFGSSVFLSDKDDYQNYLMYFTPEYNLKTYFEIFNPIDKIYQPKTLSSKEDIKLCDMVQLSLTFLYLLCDDQTQLNLFKLRQYNELFQNLIQNDRIFDIEAFNLNKERLKLINEENSIFRVDDVNLRVNRLVVLYNISRILNQADPEIKVISDGKYQSFLIDEIELQKQLKESNDIVFQDSEYVVQRINKYSIQLIYFLDQQGFELDVSGNNMFITPLHKMKEYQAICGKYSLDVYYDMLIEFIEDLNDQSIFNILEYIKIYELRKINFKLKLHDYKQMLKLFQKLQNQYSTEVFELNINFNNEDLEYFIQKLKQYYPNFNAKCFDIYEKDISCRVIKDQKQHLQKKDVSININIENFNQFFVQYIEIIKNNYAIKKLGITFKREEFHDKQKNKKQNNLPELFKLIKEMNQGDPQFIFEISFNSEVIIHNLKYITQNHFDDQIKQNINIQVTNLEIKEITCEICQMEYIGQKIIIKVFDFTINQSEIFLKIKNILEIKKNYYINIILVNCLFSFQVAQLLKHICSQYKNRVEYKFEDNYNQYCEEEVNYLQYQINVEFNQQFLNEKRLEITFYNKTKLEEKNNSQDKKQKTHIDYYEESLDEYLNLRNKTINDDSQIDKIQNFFKYQSVQYQVPILKELEIICKKQIYSQKFKFMNKKVNTDNIEDIDQIIKEIQNNNHYDKIQISNKFDKEIEFKYDDFLSHFYFYCNSEDTKTVEKFQQLYRAIFINYNRYKMRDLYSYPFDNKQIKVGQCMKYLSYQIKELICYRQDKNKIEHIFSFLELNMNLQSQLDEYVLLRYLFSLNEKSLYDSNQTDLIRQIFIKENFMHFQKYSIFRSMNSQQMFKNEQILLQLDFKSQQIGDKCFKVLFQEIEKQFPHNKMYNLLNCKLTINTLRNIYKIKKTLKLKHKLYLDLRNNNILYEDFKYFILELRGDINNQIIFKIKNYNPVLEYLFQNDLQDIVEIDNNTRGYLIAQVKIPLQQIQSKIITIELEFDDFKCDEKYTQSKENINSQNKLPNKVNNNLYKSDNEKQQIKELKLQEELSKQPEMQQLYKSINQINEAHIKIMDTQKLKEFILNEI